MERLVSMADKMCLEGGIPQDASIICPKCGYQRLPNDDEYCSKLECPKCGVIYVKFLEKLNETDSLDIRVNKQRNVINRNHLLTAWLKCLGICRTHLIVFTLCVMLIGAITVYFLSSTSSDASLFLIRHNGKYGYMNKSGMVVINPQYDDGGRFREGLAPIKQDGLWGYLGKNGHILISPQYQEVGGFFNGLAPVKIDGKWGFIDTKGKIKIDAHFDDASRFYDGIAAVTIANKRGLINTYGKYIAMPIYDNIRAPRNGITPVEANGKWGYLNSNGVMIITPQFDNVLQSFSEGLSCAVLNGKAGYIDRSGTFVIDPIYDTGSIFNKGIAGVCIDGKCGFIDNKGHLLTEMKYTDMQGGSEGMAIIGRNYRKGYIDNNGKIAIEPIYDDLRPFENGLALVLTRSFIDSQSEIPEDDCRCAKWRWSYIDKTGKVVWAEDPYFLPHAYIFSQFWDNLVAKYKASSDRFAPCSDGFENDINVMKKITSLRNSDINKMTVPDLYKSLTLIDAYSICLTLNETRQLVNMNLSQSSINMAREIRSYGHDVSENLISKLNNMGYNYKEFTLSTLH
jgi:hypothetical protein